MMRHFLIWSLGWIFLVHHLESYSPVQKPTEDVEIFFFNNSILPHEAKIISYPPGVDYNNTETFWLPPYASKRKVFTAGTRIFLVDQKQIDTVMSGNKLSGKPFLIVSKDDAGKKIKLF